MLYFLLRSPNYINLIDFRILMQQYQGRSLKMYFWHSVAIGIGNWILNIPGPILSLICTACFPCKGGSWHGLDFQTCNCMPQQNTRGVLQTEQVSIAMVCSRLSLTRLTSRVTVVLLPQKRFIASAWPVRITCYVFCKSRSIILFFFFIVMYVNSSTTLFCIHANKFSQH